MSYQELRDSLLESMPEKRYQKIDSGVVSDEEFIEELEPFGSILAKLISAQNSYNFPKTREALTRVFGHNAYLLPIPSKENDNFRHILKPTHKSWLNARMFGRVSPLWAYRDACVRYLGKRQQTDTKGFHGAYITAHGSQGYSQIKANSNIPIVISTGGEYDRIPPRDLISEMPISYNLEVTLLKMASQKWEARLASLLNENVSMVAVWRLSRESSPTMPHTIFDELEKEAYKLPTLSKEVAGSTKEEYSKQGRKFVWLLSVMPRLFQEFYQFPVGGSARFRMVYEATVIDIVKGKANSGDFWQANSLGEQRLANQEALTALIGLHGGFSDMLGHPVINSHTDLLLQKWETALFPDNGKTFIA